ncbi:hypothetical protein BT96DRAFT_1006241 [Gymnopus androsaceus JB14]|uniref:Uncharacterized protein n=1 Tax=Gymnopus androsaceus JB14 TaxID=1447944 RepID=A0A6A4GKL7_9AGAR|nr:hypothetical protein BT96DRAFT_1006241 [Gymnopus androsaceus JB14]
MLYSVGNKWEKLILDKQVHATLPDYSPFWSDRQNELLRLCQDPAPSRWDWETQLQKESSLSWEWLSFFKDHVLTLPMVGLFLDATTDSGCLGLLPVFLEAPMPVVIYCGHSKDWSTSQVLPGLFPVPSKDIVNVLVSCQAPYSSQQIPAVTSPSAVKQIPAATAPSTVQQIPAASDLFAFIKRRKDARAASIAHESASQCQACLAREENGKKDRPPGKQGACVFYWDLVDGKRVCKAAGRSSYEDLWERYGPRQQHYDSIADQ